MFIEGVVRRVKKLQTLYETMNRGIVESFMRPSLHGVLENHHKPWIKAATEREKKMQSNTIPFLQNEARGLCVGMIIFHEPGDKQGRIHITLVRKLNMGLVAGSAVWQGQEEKEEKREGKEASKPYRTPSVCGLVALK